MNSPTGCSAWILLLSSITAPAWCSGGLDSSFGLAGQAILAPDISLAAAVTQQDGKIVVVGSRAIARQDTAFVIVRVLANGRPDTGFGTNGPVQSEFDDGFDHADAVAVQTGGRHRNGGLNAATIDGGSAPKCRRIPAENSA